MAALTTDFGLITTLIGIALFAGQMAAFWLGQRISRRRAQARASEPPPVASGSVGAVGATIFGLLGLLIAFSFSGAAARFDTRRDLIVEEANAIGTAYLRLDLLQPSARAPLQEKFRRYLDARLSTYDSRSLPLFRSEQLRAIGIQSQIWSDAVKAANEAGSPMPQVLLPPINELIDISTTRDAAVEKHPPIAIYLVLILLALLSALLAGIELAPTRAAWVLKVIFSGTIALTLWLTLDLEHPRLGLIRVTDTDHFLIDLRQSMK